MPVGRSVEALERFALGGYLEPPAAPPRVLAVSLGVLWLPGPSFGGQEVVSVEGGGRCGADELPGNLEEVVRRSALATWAEKLLSLARV